MIRTASKETVGQCIICEGTGWVESDNPRDVYVGTFSSDIVKRLKATSFIASPAKECTHCQGSGLQPQRLICPHCHGIGGHSTGRGINHSCITCKTCAGNGWTLLRLSPGQKFESAEVLP